MRSEERADGAAPTSGKDSQVTGAADVTPDDIRRVDEARIHRLLEQDGLHYRAAEHGACEVTFGPRLNRDIQLVVVLEALEGGTLGMTAVLNARYPAVAAPLLLGTINQWHSHHCWPRGYIGFETPEGERVGTIAVHADHHLYLASGAHDALLRDAFWVFVQEADNLLYELHEAVQRRCTPATPVADDLEAWLKRQGSR